MVGSHPRSVSLTGCAALGKLFNFCIPHSRILYRDQGWHLPHRVVRIKQFNKCKAQKNCLLLGRNVMSNLDSILKSRDFTLSTKVCLVKAIVLPVVMYGYESWTIKKAEC